MQESFVIEWFWLYSRAKNACFDVLSIAKNRLLALGSLLFQAKSSYNDDEVGEVKRLIPLNCAGS